METYRDTDTGIDSSSYGGGGGQKHLSSVYRNLPPSPSPATAGKTSRTTSASPSRTSTPRRRPLSASVASGMTPRAQHWAIIDALEEGGAATAEPATLVAAYLQLAALYEQNKDKTGAQMARENAEAIQSAAVTGAAKNSQTGLEVQKLVFQFCLDVFKEGAAVDEQAVSIAATRLADIHAQLYRGDTPLPTPRERHWRIIDLLESTTPHVDIHKLTSQYEELAQECERCGDLWGAVQARESAQLVQLGSDVERQLFYIDKMEESDLIDLDALSVAYAELAKLYTSQGDVAYAVDAEKDAQRLHTLFINGGMQNRTPRNVLFPDPAAAGSGGGGGGGGGGYYGDENDNGGDYIYDDDTPHSAKERYNPRPRPALLGGMGMGVDMGMEGNVSCVQEENSRDMLNDRSQSLDHGQSEYALGMGGIGDGGSIAEQGSVVSGLTFNPGQSIGSLDSAAGFTADGSGDGGGGVRQIQRLPGAQPSHTGRNHRKSAVVAVKPDLSQAKYQKGQAIAPEGAAAAAVAADYGTDNEGVQSKFFNNEPSVHGSSLAQKSLMSFGSLASDATVQNVVTIDCTTIAMGHLEDMLIGTKVKLVHLHARFTACEKLKGKCEITLTYSTGKVVLTYKWAYQLVFVVVHDGREFHGKLHLTHMTKENIFTELKPYPQEITWKDGISPKGVDYNQVVAVLQSSKCRNQFREGYRQFEEVVIAAYMPRFQQARTGAVYKNLEGKKGAVYNLKDVSRVISEIGDSSLSSNGNGGEKIHVGRVGDRLGHHHSPAPHTPPQQQDGSRTPPQGNPHKHFHKPHHEHHSTKAKDVAP